MTRQFLGIFFHPMTWVCVCSFVALSQIGCSEGPLWKVSRFAPWVQEKWQAEEKLAETVYSKRRKLKEIAADASSLSAEESDLVANELAQVLKNERTLIVRIETARTLGKVKGQLADAVLADAVHDEELEVRIAAVQAWKHRDQAQALPILQGVITSDTNDDVRREAIRSLAEFRGPQVVQTLESALSDKDPATQYRTIETLRKVTGQNLGFNVVEWRNYLQRRSPQQPEAQLAGKPEPPLQ